MCKISSSKSRQQAGKIPSGTTILILLLRKGQIIIDKDEIGGQTQTYNILKEKSHRSKIKTEN